MRYKKENTQTDMKYKVKRVLPIFSPLLCHNCKHYFIREFGFRIYIYELIEKLSKQEYYRCSELKNIFVCSTCAKDKEKASIVFLKNKRNFIHIAPPPPMPQIVESLNLKTNIFS